MDEEVVLLEEQLSAAHAEIRRLESRLADSEAQAATSVTETAGLRSALEAAEQAVTERDGAIEAHLQAIATARDQTQRDASRYRELVLAREPELPADLVRGDTVDAIEEALLAARQTVAQVRQHLEQQAQAIRVPTDAPVRAAPDYAGLSAAEKIRLGLQSA